MYTIAAYTDKLADTEVVIKLDSVKMNIENKQSYGRNFTKHFYGANMTNEEEKRKLIEKVFNPENKKIWQLK